MARPGVPLDSCAAAVLAEWPVRGALFPVALAISLYTVAVTMRRAEALAAAVLAAGVVLPAAGRWPAAQLAASRLRHRRSGAVLVVGLYVDTRRAYLAELRERALRLERERDQNSALAAAVERARIAREMHDSVAHHLTVIVALSDGALARSDQRTRPGRRRDSGCVAHGPARRWPRPAACSACCGPTPGRISGSRCPAWPTWTICWAGSGPLACRSGTNAAGAAADLPPGLQLAVFRLVQEALTNTMKHGGPGASAAVRLQFTRPRCAWRSRTTAPARRRTARSGGGLTGMRERISVFGGELDCGPRQPQGWRVSCPPPRRPGGRMISVLLVDDHPLIRKGFRLILDAETDIQVAGEAGDGTTAVSMCSALRPDVVLMDVRMPGGDGIEATREIVAAGLPSKVLILTTFDLDDYVYAGLRAGASGFLLKDTQPDDLVAAIRIVAVGDAVLSPTATKRLIQQFAATRPPALPGGRGARRDTADPHRPGTGRLLPHRRRHVQQRDRGTPAPVRRHGEDPCRPDTGQARPA